MRVSIHNARERSALHPTLNCFSLAVTTTKRADLKGSPFNIHCIWRLQLHIKGWDTFPTKGQRVKCVWVGKWSYIDQNQAEQMIKPNSPKSDHQVLDIEHYLWLWEWLPFGQVIMWSLGVKGQTLTIIFLWTWFDYFDHVNSYLLFFSEPLCFCPCSLEQHLRWGHKVVSMGTRWWWFFQHPIRYSHTLVINVTGSAVDCTSACCVCSQQSQLPCYGGGHPVQLMASPQVLVPSFLSQTLQCKDGSHRVHTENCK